MLSLCRPRIVAAWISALLAVCVLQASDPQRHEADGQIHEWRSQVIQASDFRERGPLWVPLAAAFNPDGSLNRELLGEQGSTAVESLAITWDRRPPEHHPRELATNQLGEALWVTQLECGAVSSVVEQSAGIPCASLADVLENAGSVAIGRINGIELGFSRGRPGQLLVVQVEQVLSNVTEHRPADTFLLFYQEAKLAVRARYYYCYEGSFGAVPPRVGDKVLLTPYALERHRANQFLEFHSWEVPVLVRANGTVVPARRYLADPILNGVDTEEALVDRIGFLISKAGRCNTAWSAGEGRAR